MALGGGGGGGGGGSINYMHAPSLDQKHRKRKRNFSSFPQKNCSLSELEWVTLSNQQLMTNGHGYPCLDHDDVIKWKHYPRYWPFVRGIHRSPGNSSHKGQWRGALMFSLICAWINGWVNNREAGDLIRNRTHYDFTVMILHISVRCESYHDENITSCLSCISCALKLWLNQ